MNPGARVLSIVPDKTVELPADETGASVSAKPMLKFERVGFEYDGRSIMRDVSFAVRPGELVALLGPSGCGKTTILNLVAGFLQPTDGVAFIDNREIAGPGPDRGVVFQAAALFNWMTVADNISSACAAPAVRRRSASKSRRRWQRSSASPASRIPIPISSPAACGSGWALPACSPQNRKSC